MALVMHLNDAFVLMMSSFARVLFSVEAVMLNGWFDVGQNFLEFNKNKENDSFWSMKKSCINKN